MVIRRVGPLSCAKVAGLLYLILGFIVGLPLVGTSDVGRIVAVAGVLAFGVIEQRVLAAGEGWDWRLIIPYLAAWLVSYLRFTRGL